MTPQQFSQKLKKQQDELKRYIERDAFIFSGLKAHKQLSQALSLLKDDKGAIRPYHQFEQEIVKLNNSYNKLYLEAEYEFAVHSAQSAARWDGLSNDTDRYWLQYRTAQDERVREDHAALAGTTLPKDDPFWDSYYPPNGWRCRCVAVEVLARDNKLSDSKKAIEKGEVSTTQIGKNGKNKLAMFRFNPGKQQKLFPPKNSYVPKGCGGTLAITNAAFLALDDEGCRAKKLIEEKAKENQNKYIQKIYEQATEFGNKSKAIARELGIKVTPVNLKKQNRIIEKANLDYGGDISKVNDIVRNTFVASGDKIEKTIQAISKKFEVVNIKRQNTPEGYTGVLMNVKQNGVIMECQVNTPQMIFGKSKGYNKVLDKTDIKQLENGAKLLGIEAGKGHGYYERIRVLDDEIDKSLIKSLTSESKAYYKKIRSIEINAPQK